MSRNHILALLSLCLVSWSVPPRQTYAQQVTISVPRQGISDNFFEYVGGNWSLMGPGYFATFGGLAGPPFGGFDPNLGLNTSLSFGQGDRNGRLNFSAGTARSTTIVSETPYLTVTNGIPGFFFAGRLTPFVTSYVPIFGPPPAALRGFNNLGAANTITGRMQRGEFHVRNGRVIPHPAPGLKLPPELAARPFLFHQDKKPVNPLQESPEEKLAVQRALLTQQTRPKSGRFSTEKSSAQAAEYIEKAEKLVAEGKPGAAKLLFQIALKQASPQQQEWITNRLKQIGSASP